MNDFNTGIVDADQSLAALAALSAVPFTTLSEAVDTVLQMVMRYLGVRTAFVSQLTPSNMVVIDSHDAEGCAIPPDGVVPIRETFCQYVQAEGVPVIIPNASVDDRVIHVATRRDFNIGAYAGVPLILGDGSLYGTLCAVDPTPRAFSDAQVSLLRIAASMIAAHIDREQRVQTLESEVSEARQDMARMQTQLDQQMQALYVVAHDLRTPLTGMVGYAELLQQGIFGSMSVAQAEALDRIRNAGKSANRLINDIIDAAAAEGRSLSILSMRFAPRQLAEQIVDTCTPKAAAKQLEIKLDCTAAPETMVADADRMAQVLTNLVSNAIRYTEAGKVTVSVAAYDDAVEFRVTDTGPGIPDHLQNVIWERFARGTTHGKGLGLGLATVKQLVEAMGGSVGVQSIVGAGSSFWVRLPPEGPHPQQVAWH